MDDLEDIVLDEIALEGLNGISLEGLWVLLEQRQVPFPLKCDESTKNFIWDDLLCMHETISFYCIPEELKQCDDNVIEKTTVSKDKGSKSSATDQEIMIDDPFTKDRGYCPYYYKRKDVTGEIRKNTESTSLTLQQVMEKWGNSMVLVASQEARMKALVSPVSSSDLFINTAYYCCLETVGRSRYKGASQPSISNQLKFGTDCSYVFHMCKGLMTKGLVCKETIENTAYIYLIRFKPSHQTNRRTKCEERIIDFLDQKPDKMAARYELVEHVLKPEEGITWSQFKKTVKSMKDTLVIEPVSVLAKDLPQFSSPDVTNSLDEYIQKVRKEVGDSSQTGKKVQDFSIPCVRLVDQNTVHVDEEAEDEEDLKVVDENVPDIGFSMLNLDLHVYDAHRLYDFVHKNGREGVSENEMRCALMIDKYRLKALLKKFTRSRLLRTFTFTPGRIRKMKYFTQLAIDEGIVPEQVLKMCHQERKGKTLKESTQRKAEDPVTVQSSPETGGSTDHLPPRVSKPTSKPDRDTQDSKGKKNSQTFKNLQRRQQILDHIADVRVIEIHSLHKHIKKVEADMGIKTECCRKSIFRMVANLEKEGKLNYFTRKFQRRPHLKPEEIKLVSGADFDPDGPVVQALLDKISVKPIFIAPKKENMPEVYRKLQVKTQDNLEEVKNESMAMSEILKAKMTHSHSKRKIMEKYGYTGKMFRLEILHKFLWYILFEKQTQEVIMEPLEKIQRSNQAVKTEKDGEDMEMQHFSNNSSSNENGQGAINESRASEVIPMTHIPCYLDNASDWRRYVGPGKGQHAGRAKSWATMTDILPTIPLSLFLQIVSIGVPIADLDAMLEHPRMKHYPIEVLSTDIIDACDIKHAISSIHNSLVGLSGMGLLYFDRDQKCQAKKEVNFSLCQSGSFLDTSSSAPSSVFIEDKEYPKKVYKFTSLEEVNQFWLDYRVTCFSTRLGAVKQTYVDTKKDSMTLAMVAENIHETPPDPLEIPGDHRGAAGLDSSFHAHRTVSWNKMGVKIPRKARPKVKFPFTKKSQTEQESREKALKGTVKIVTVSAAEHKKKTVGGKGQKRKVSKDNSKSKKSKVGERRSSDPGDSGLTEIAEQEKSMAKMISQEAEKTKKVKPKSKSKTPLVSQEAEKPVKVKPKSKSKTRLVRNLHIHDEEDLIAMQKKVLKRVKWSPREDNLIILCGLALRILQVKCPKTDKRKSFLGWTAVRDVLKENLEESFDKTSDAAGRRYRCLLRDPTNKSNFSVCLTDIYADKKIMGDFMARKGNYDDGTVRVQEFKELCMVLSKKFESRNKIDMLVLPSTLSELYQKYDVMDSTLPVATTMEEFEFNDVQSDEDITLHILHKVVLISLLSQYFRRNDMKEIYFALRQYKQSQLHRAMLIFKNHGFLGRNRSGMMEAVNVNRAIHLLPMSFQFTKRFFRVFEAPSIPSLLLEETSATLDNILTAHKQESSQTSGDDPAALCIDDMRGNKSSVLCIPALEMASDSVDIPKSIISLEMSSSDKARLQERHRLALMMAMDGGDLQDEDENDESLSGIPKELKRKAPEIGERVAPKKIRKHLVGAVGRKKVSFIREAHERWRQSMADAAEPDKSKAPKRSLIPRLLANRKSLKTVVDLDASKVAGQTQSPAIPSLSDSSTNASPSDSSARARCSVALDHDYFPQEMDKAPEVLQHQSPTLSAPSTGEGDAALMKTGNQVDDEFSAATAPTEETKNKTSDSFFTWLMMRGFVDEDYAKKPQAIHEDLIVKRCSVSFMPTPSLVHFLDKFHVPASPEVRQQQKASQGLESSQPGHRCSETEVKTDQPCQNRILSKSCSEKHRTMESLREDHIKNLGELMCRPCEPFQAFRSLIPNIELRPSLDFTVREHPRSLEDICNGHNESDLLSTIYQHVRRAGSFGLSYPHLLDSLGLSRKHRRDTVSSCIKVLLHEQLVLEIGITVVRLVAHKWASKWLLRTVKLVPKSPNTPPSDSISPRKKAKLPFNSAVGPTNEDESLVIDAPKMTDLETQKPSNAIRNGGSTSELDQSKIQPADANWLRSTACTEADLTCTMPVGANLQSLSAERDQGGSSATDENLPSIAPAIVSAGKTPPNGNVSIPAPEVSLGMTTSSDENLLSKGLSRSPSFDGNSSSLAPDNNPAGMMHDDEILPSEGPNGSPSTDTNSTNLAPVVETVGMIPDDGALPTKGLDGLPSTDGNLTSLAPDVDLAGTMHEDGVLPSDALVGKKRKKVETMHPVMEYEPVTIICRPWTNIDGSLNSKSLNMFVTSVGLLIISKPGIKESDVFDHFQKIINPVDCLHVIKILMNADVISRHSTYTVRKLNLFSPPSYTKPKPLFFYQPTAGALMNLALLKDNIIQS